MLVILIMVSYWRRILTCNWQRLWWCMHVLKTVDVDCWWLVVEHMHWLSHMFMHSRCWCRIVYPYWRWQILCIHIGDNRIFISILVTTECFAFILGTIMIQLYLEVTTSVLTWYHIHIESCLGALHNLIGVILAYVHWWIMWSSWICASVNLVNCVTWIDDVFHQRFGRLVEF